MTLDLDRLMSLWDSPPGPAAAADLAGLYRDPFVLNGSPSSPAAMAATSRVLHKALTGQRRETLC